MKIKVKVELANLSSLKFVRVIKIGHVKRIFTK